MDALVIPDLGALDEYAAFWGIMDGLRLSADLGRAAFQHPGPVYVLDDQRPRAGGDSRPRESFMRLLRSRPDTVWVLRGRGDAGLEEALRDLAVGMASDGVTAVRLGGAWLDREGPGGAVHRAHELLSPWYEAAVDADITGFGRPP